MLESLFDGAAGLEACNFIKMKLQHRCFPDNILKFLRTSILKKIWERLVLVRENPYSGMFYVVETMESPSNSSLVETVFHCS